MPLMMDMTAMRVVVARIMPSRVRKLLSLLPRSDATATEAASEYEALEGIDSIQRYESLR